VSLRVLICDDTMFMRTVIAKMVQDGGHEVVGEAGSGDEAVARYAELKPDVVTMDVVMPDVGGIEAVKRIVEADPKARIVMCSAMGQEKLIEQAMQAGAARYVVKPFDASKLLGALEDAASSVGDA
jgi:two-component system chemotaxis response regulator CheY